MKKHAAALGINNDHEISNNYKINVHH